MRRHSPKAHSILGGVVQPLGAHGTRRGQFWLERPLEAAELGPEPPASEAHASREGEREEPKSYQ